MSTTLERLRRLQQMRPQRSTRALDETPLPPAQLAPTQPPAQHNLLTPYQATLASDSAVTPRALEELSGGGVERNLGGECFVRTHRYPLHHYHGPTPLGDLLALAPATLAGFHPNFNLHPALLFEQAAFIDTETTGLGGGASVYPFMVGVGTFETDPSLASAGAHHFVVRQFFMRHPGEESAVLAALAQILADRAFTVTFNGRSFDLPLLRTRYFFNRGLVADADRPPLLEEDQPHLDLLFPARRLWKRRLQSCRLTNLELHILGLARSGDDVPGHLIPQLYMEFLQHNDASMMERVFYHNHEDILAMVGVATQMYHVYESASSADRTVPTPPRSGADWLALGNIYELRNEWTTAEAAYRQALTLLNDVTALAETLDRLARLLKRSQRWAEAAACWEQWLTTAPGAGLTPYVELAKYCEWQINDLEQAEMWTRWAIHTAQADSGSGAGSPDAAQLQHRLARILRKRSQ